MENRILYAMAADLGIDRYINESKSQYCDRVLYSAMASWIKAAALDQPITSTQESDQGVSRRHILDKCTSVLNEMLKRFPESKSWFETASDEDSPVAVLLSRLIRHGDLLQVGFGTNLILAGSNRMPLSLKMKCRKGEILLQGTQYSGIAMIQKVQEDTTFKPKPIPDVTSWFRDYVRSAWWKSADTNENVQYFNAYRKSYNNHSCWQLEQPEAVEGVWLARRNIFQNGYEYFLLRQEDDLYKHRIDPFLQQIGEQRRVMMAMRHIVHNDVLVQVCHHEDHASVKLRVWLPQKENFLLETYGWPHNSITDKLEWDMGRDVWEFVEPQLCGLGLTLTEEGESHG